MPRRNKKQTTGEEGDSPGLITRSSGSDETPSLSVYLPTPSSRWTHGGTSPVRIPRHLARLDSMHAMRFVGVGGSTNKDRYGPERRHAGGAPRSFSPSACRRVYALSHHPSFNGLVDDCFNGQLDFLPRFEILDVSRSQVIDGCHWKPLPRPPCFPWDLTPYQYRRLSPLQAHCTISYTPMSTLESTAA